MKKIVALVLALMLLCCSFALAEDAAIKRSHVFPYARKRRWHSQGLFFNCFFIVTQVQQSIQELQLVFPLLLCYNKLE